MPYLKFALFYLLLLPGHHCVSGQSDGPNPLENGIYFVLEEGRCRDNKVKKINAFGTLCVPDNPMLIVGDIETVGKLVENQLEGSRAIRLQLSAEARGKLAAITEVYHGKKMVLVLNNKAVSILTVKRTISSGEIILREGLEKSTLSYIRRVLLE